MSDQIRVDTDALPDMGSFFYDCMMKIQGHSNVLMAARNQFEPGIGSGPVSDSIRKSYDPQAESVHTGGQLVETGTGSTGGLWDETVAGLTATEAQTKAAAHLGTGT